MEDDIIADAALLMRLHHVALEIVVRLRAGKAADAREHGEGLHTKFAHEAGHALTQDLEGLTAVPYAPVVAFAETHLLWATPVHRVGAALDIGTQRVFLTQRLGDELAEEGFVVVPELFIHLLRVALCPAPVLQRFADLIVATPRRHRGVLTQTADVVHQLTADILQEGTIARIGGAGEHKVLPDEDTACIRFVVEGIFLVRPPTPDAEHVEVRASDVVEELLAVGLRAGREKQGAGDIVRALSEERLPIDTEEEALPVPILLTHQLDRSQPDSALRHVKHTATLTREKLEAGLIAVGLP